MGRMMLAGLVAALAAAPGAAADPPKLDGVWLFDAAKVGDKNNLQPLWGSTVVIGGGKARITNFLETTKALTGTLTLDPAAPGTADIDLDEYVVTEFGAPMTVAGGVRKGVYTLAGDTLTVALAREPSGPRPAGTGPAKSLGVVRLALVRAPQGVTGPPTDVAVTVTAADGKPAPGVALTTHLQLPQVITLPAGAELPKGRVSPGVTFVRAGEKPPAADPDAPPAFGTLATTGPDGVAKVKYAELGTGKVVAYDAKHRQMAVGCVTPAGLAGGKVALTLSNQCRVTVPASCPELAGAGHPAALNSYIYAGDPKDNVRFMYAAGTAVAGGAKLEFLAPAGEYAVEVYSHDIVGKSVKFTVPADGRSAFTAPAVELKPNALALLRGKPAPELSGVVGFHGAPFKLSDFKGKYVIVDFWGYWCGPCVVAMPALFEVHDKFPGEVVVVTVHQDADGEVKSAADLDAKLVSITKDEWKGRKLQLRTALISGRDDAGKAGGAAKDYGVTGWPTTILIGPDGKVVGDVHFRDVDTAVRTMNALMGKPPAKPAAPKDEP